MADHNDQQQALTPQRIVDELDRYIIGQGDAKRAVAIALRNRLRRQKLPDEMRQDITPKNILMMGPTGVGKTEIARRLARLVNAPFVKVEATRFTQVGYVGRDVDSIIRDLVEAALAIEQQEQLETVREMAAKAAEQKLVELLTEKAYREASARARRAARATASAAMGTASRAPRMQRVSKAKIRNDIAEQLANKELEDHQIEIEIEVDEAIFPLSDLVEDDDDDETLRDIFGLPPRRRKRSVTVREARRLLAEDEAIRLVDQSSLMRAAVNRAEQLGIVFLDEIDKVVSIGAPGGPDVSGEGVQRDLLPFIEGTTLSTRYGAVRTDHILWIAAGAFSSCKPSDLIPELQGRLPIRVGLEPLGVEDFRRILAEPENALTRQYTALLATEGLTLAFTDDGVDELARAAYQMNERVENIGARRLHTIMERLLEDVSFAADRMSGQTVKVDRAFVRERLSSLLADEDLSRYIL